MLKLGLRVSTTTMMSATVEHTPHLTIYAQLNLNLIVLLTLSKVECFFTATTMANDNMNADNLVLQMYRNKTITESFWSGIKMAAVALALVWYIYSHHPSLVSTLAVDEWLRLVSSGYPQNHDHQRV